MTFENGHEPHYTGGSKPGHAPTSFGNPDHVRTFTQPGGAGFAHRFDQPGGKANQRKGGNRKKDDLRKCLASLMKIEPDGKTIEECSAKVRHRIAPLMGKYPKRMVRMLFALLSVAEDPTQREFMNAQRQVATLLTTNASGRKGEDDDEETGPDTITVKVGRLEVPLPGSEQEEGREAPPAR